MTSLLIMMEVLWKALVETEQVEGKMSRNPKFSANPNYRILYYLEDHSLLDFIHFQDSPVSQTLSSLRHTSTYESMKTDMVKDKKKQDLARTTGQDLKGFLEIDRFPLFLIIVSFVYRRYLHWIKTVCSIMNTKANFNGQ